MKRGIATFNVENLFSRPKAMNNPRWKAGQPALEAAGRGRQARARATGAGAGDRRGGGRGRQAQATGAGAVSDVVA